MRSFRFLTRWYSIVLIILIVFFLSITIFVYVKRNAIQPPQVGDTTILSEKPVRVDANFSYFRNSWIRKRSPGLYEMYVEGKPFERGVAIGKLSGALVQNQEKVFIEKISELIPSERYRTMLTSIIAVFNADIDNFIPLEFREEIYGISFNASHDYDMYGNPYQRQLNYHAAHDIGHMMQNYMLVGCTSFSVWDEKGVDNKLLTGRNFDFFFGEKFSENKIVMFVNPDKGNRFAFITWGGMIGVVSGMNEYGLSVTVNAGTPKIPFSTGTPVSIMAREILQYAKNIDEAVAIANKCKLFVSESFHITSALDSSSVIIEKTPEETQVVYPKSNSLICTNFYQSDAFANTEENIENKNQNASFYRYQRVEELLNAKTQLDYTDVISILRNRNGLHDKYIGNGNEKAVNQLLAHHGIVFSPYERTFWISAGPNIIGQFVAYNLDTVFSKLNTLKDDKVVEITRLKVPDDKFLTDSIKIFNLYKLYRKDVLEADIAHKLSDGEIREFLILNPNYFEPYMLIGDYFMRIEESERAISFYENALELEIPSQSIVNQIKENIEELKDKK